MSKISSKIIATLLAVMGMVVLMIISVYQLQSVEMIIPSPMGFVLVILMALFIYLYQRETIKRDDN